MSTELYCLPLNREGKLSPALAYFIPLAIFFTGAVFFIFNYYSLFGFPLDDAWIHRVYSRSFAFGQGFAYNAGIQEAGETSPFWAILTAPAHWIEGLGGTDAVVALIKLIGFSLGLTLIHIFQRLAEKLGDSQLTGLVASSLLALEPRLLFSVFSGMENILLITLWLTAVYLFIKRKWWISCLLFGLTPVTRPEALLLIPVCLFSYFFIAREKLSRKSLPLLLLFVPVICWSLFCKYATGHFLPNTFYLKSRPFSLNFDVLKFTENALLQHGLVSWFIFITGIIFFIFLLIHKKNYMTKITFIFFFLAPAVYYLAVIGTRQVTLNGYYWTRWIDPASIILMIPFCIGYAGLLTGKFYFLKFAKDLNQHKKKILVRAVITVSAAGLITMLPGFAGSYQNRKMHLSSDSRAIHLMNVAAGKWIARNTPEECRLGVNDSGAIKYFGKRYTVDLIGLNNAEIAFGRGGIEQVFQRLDWLAVFPPWFNRVKELIINNYRRVQIFSLPLKEYTICNCPDQLNKVIYKRIK